MPALSRPQKITFGELRDMGVRGVLIYSADYHCSHSIALEVVPIVPVAPVAPPRWRNDAARAVPVPRAEAAPEPMEADELVSLEEADAKENTGKVKAVVPESGNDTEIDETVEDDDRDDDDSTIIADEEEGDEDVTDIIGNVSGDEET